MYFTMRHLLLSVLCAAIFISSPELAFSAEDDLSGFTLNQLEAAINKSGIANQKLYSILTFDSVDRHGAKIAVLSGSRSGWHVVVLRRAVGGLEVEWRSGKLPDDFSVSDSRSLTIEDIGDEQVVEFSGCAPHQCGRLDGTFGVLLYSQRSKQAFFAHYRYDEDKPLGSFGGLEFSNNANEIENKQYKMALQKVVSTILHSTVR